MDLRRRELERAYQQTGDVNYQAQLLHHRIQVGELRPHKVRLAALFGDAGAQLYVASSILITNYDPEAWVRLLTSNPSFPFVVRYEDVTQLLFCITDYLVENHLGEFVLPENRQLFAQLVEATKTAYAEGSYPADYIGGTPMQHALTQLAEDPSIEGGMYPSLTESMLNILIPLGAYAVTSVSTSEEYVINAAFSVFHHAMNLWENLAMGRGRGGVLQTKQQAFLRDIAPCYLAWLLR